MNTVGSDVTVTASYSFNFMVQKKNFKKVNDSKQNTSQVSGMN